MGGKNFTRVTKHHITGNENSCQQQNALFSIKEQNHKRWTVEDVLKMAGVPELIFPSVVCSQKFLCFKREGAHASVFVCAVYFFEGLVESCLFLLRYCQHHHRFGAGPDLLVLLTPASPGPCASLFLEGIGLNLHSLKRLEHFFTAIGIVDYKKNSHKRGYSF
jgi:hypothetical protein